GLDGFLVGRRHLVRMVRPKDALRHGVSWVGGGYRPAPLDVPDGNDRSPRCRLQCRGPRILGRAGFARCPIVVISRSWLLRSDRKLLESEVVVGFSCGGPFHPVEAR